MIGFKAFYDCKLRCLHALSEFYFFRDKTFDDVIETVSAMNAVVDRLYQAAKKLTWARPDPPSCCELYPTEHMISALVTINI